MLRFELPPQSSTSTGANIWLGLSSRLVFLLSLLMVASESQRSHLLEAAERTFTHHLADEQETDEQAEEDDFYAELERYTPGITAKYRLPDGETFETVQPAILIGEQGAGLDPRALSHTLDVRYAGLLNVQNPGEHRLFIYAAGNVRLKLAGQEILNVQSELPAWHHSAWIDLDFGHHELLLEYSGAVETGELRLFWQGPQFRLEPVSPRNLAHDKSAVVTDSFTYGRDLSVALRCANCHALPEASHPAPDLDKLAGNLNRPWLMQWLTTAHSPPNETSDIPAQRRMPYFALDEADAKAIAAVLLPAEAPPADQHEAAALPGDIANGEQLLLTIGCLACHTVSTHESGEMLGESGLFGGGELSEIADKRPAEFFAHWLKDPAALNAAHRMPVFELSDDDRRDLAAYLSTLRTAEVDNSSTTHSLAGTEQTRGLELLTEHRCGSCHQLPGADDLARHSIRLDSASTAESGCLSAPTSQHPGYQLPEEESQALLEYFRAVSQARDATDPVETEPSLLETAPPSGELVLRQRRCLSCHERDLERGIKGNLERLLAAHPELAAELPVLAPPALSGVGDKLHDEAIAAAIARRDKPLRPWLKVQMPRFNLTPAEQQALVDYFIAADRIPEGQDPTHDWPELATSEAQQLAGGRLVTAEGFGCNSCHQIGSSAPTRVDLNARGTDLSQAGRRLRRAWFDRWVRNPARIVPAMEMPSIQLPIRGVLDDQLEGQLAAVWHVLNLPDFEPPAPGALRIVRRRNDPQQPERAAVLTDVLRLTKKESLIKPLVLGLANRHNVLYDLAEARLAGWWIGDTARQRTEGKTWYWEPGGSEFVSIKHSEAPELRLISSAGKPLEPQRAGQWLTEFQEVVHTDSQVEFRSQLNFAADDVNSTGSVTQAVWQTQGFTPWEATEPPRVLPNYAVHGWQRTVRLQGFAPRQTVQFRILPENAGERGASFTDDGKNKTWLLTGPLGPIQVRLLASSSPPLEIRPDGWISFSKSDSYEFTLLYTTGLPADRYLSPEMPPLTEAAVELPSVPGFTGERLPLTSELMPTAFAWRPTGELVIASLKGRVWLASDTDADGREDNAEPFSDELAAPYGLHVHGTAIDCLNKYALLRLHDDDVDGRADRMETLASGWGHTTDYHDWAVGLPRDAEGNYYVALPCQQDNRSPEAAHLRGRGLKLSQRTPTEQNPHHYSIEEYCRGLRFPMGLLFDAEQRLLASDNQGNFNPFNELNHLLPGHDYGFVNKLEREQGVRSHDYGSAIWLPHPWTRSVNGLCLLQTPPELLEKSGSCFGPFEGHLLGCEYDTRRLVRMSLQQVGDRLQGAVYPFSLPPEDDLETFMGPVCCAVSPAGQIYVGSMRDSGWGGGTNTGSIERLLPTGDLPCGIAEVQATPRGFRVKFTQPVARETAATATAFKVESYRRESTPAYGGDDKDRRRETVREVQFAEDGLAAELTLDALRPGHVYEIRVGDIAPNNARLWPAEAHYTLQEIPAE